MKNKKSTSAVSVIIGIVILLTVFAFRTGLFSDANYTDDAQNIESVNPENRETQSPTLKFKNEKQLKEHYEKHGKNMGFKSAEEYEAAAAAVVMNKTALHKIEKEDGDDVYYLKSTNEFVIVSTDGYIRTYFKPDSGIDYYNRQ